MVFRYLVVFCVAPETHTTYAHPWSDALTGARLGPRKQIVLCESIMVMMASSPSLPGLPMSAMSSSSDRDCCCLVAGGGSVDVRVVMMQLQVVARVKGLGDSSRRQERRRYR